MGSSRMLAALNQREEAVYTFSPVDVVPRRPSSPPGVAARTPFLSAVALPPRIGCIEPLSGPSVRRRANFSMLARPRFVLR